METLDAIHGWLAALPPLVVYLSVLGVTYGENVFPPVPGDVLLVVAGMIAATGAVSLPVVVVLAAAAGAFGFMTVYAAGRRAGNALLAPDRYGFVPKAELRRALGLVPRYGAWIVLVNRFLPGLRSVIGLAIGMSRMPVGRVALLGTVSSVAWSVLIVGMGYALADNRAAIARVLGSFERVGVVLMGLLAVGLAVWVVRARRRRAAMEREAG